MKNFWVNFWINSYKQKLGKRGTKIAKSFEHIKSFKPSLSKLEEKTQNSGEKTTKHKKKKNKL